MRGGVVWSCCCSATSWRCAEARSACPWLKRVCSSEIALTSASPLLCREVGYSRLNLELAQLLFGIHQPGIELLGLLVEELRRLGVMRKMNVVVQIAINQSREKIMGPVRIVRTEGDFDDIRPFDWPRGEMVRQLEGSTRRGHSRVGESCRRRYPASGICSAETEYLTDNFRPAVVVAFLDSFNRLVDQIVAGQEFDLRIEILFAHRIRDNRRILRRFVLQIGRDE